MLILLWVGSDLRSEVQFQLNCKENEIKFKNSDFKRIGAQDLRGTGAMFYLLSYEIARWEEGKFLVHVFPCEEK